VADASSYELTDLPVPSLVKINSTSGETEMAGRGEHGVQTMIVPSPIINTDTSFLAHLPYFIV
jgi:hypothetical protein